MRLDLRRDSMILIPESDQDRAYIEDTFGLRNDGDKMEFERVEEVAMGYKKSDQYVLKSVKKEIK